MPIAITVHKNAGVEKLPLQVTTRFSVRYCRGVLLRPRACHVEAGVVLEPVEPERQPLAEMAEDES